MNFMFINRRTKDDSNGPNQTRIVAPYRSAQKTELELAKPQSKITPSEICNSLNNTSLTPTEQIMLTNYFIKRANYYVQSSLVSDFIFGAINLACIASFHSIVKDDTASTIIALYAAFVSYPTYKINKKWISIARRKEMIELAKNTSSNDSLCEEAKRTLNDFIETSEVRNRRMPRYSVL